MTVATQGRTHVKHSATPISVAGGCSGKAKVVQLDASRSVRRGKVINTVYFSVLFEDHQAPAKYEEKDRISVIQSVRVFLKSAMNLPDDQVIDFDKPAMETIWKQYQKSAITVQ